MNNKSIILLRLAGLLLLLASPVHADFAVLVHEAVLVEKTTESEEESEVEVLTDATYLTFGGWAVTDADFIDVTAMSFDFQGVSSVSSAILRLPIEAVYSQDDSAPLQLEVFSDNGLIELTDYSIGFPIAYAQQDAFDLSQLEFDVTAAVNAALNTGSFVGFRLSSTLARAAVDVSTVPKFAGVKFFPDQFELEFTPGSVPATSPDIGAFDGYTLEVPLIDAPGLGQGYAQFRLVDINNQIFQLTKAVVDAGEIEPPPVGYRALRL